MKLALTDEAKKFVAIHKLKLIRSDFSQQARIGAVKLPFSSKVWCQLANSKGQLLPACCSAVSALRNCFIEALRDGGRMDVNNIRRIKVMEGHHDYDATHPVVFVRQIYDALHPWMRFNDYIDTISPAELPMTWINNSHVWEYAMGEWVPPPVGKAICRRIQAVHMISVLQSGQEYFRKKIGEEWPIQAFVVANNVSQIVRIDDELAVYDTAWHAHEMVPILQPHFAQPLAVKIARFSPDGGMVITSDEVKQTPCSQDQDVEAKSKVVSWDELK